MVADTLVIADTRVVVISSIFATQLAIRNGQFPNQVELIYQGFLGPRRNPVKKYCYRIGA